jgi:predicted metal-dependent hydrolase
MQKTLIVSGKRIEYRIRRNRKARSVRLSVSCSEGVAITAPWFVPDIIAERFVRAKAEWILRKLSELSGREAPLLSKTGKRDYERNKADALAFIRNRVEHWNRLYGFSYGKISVRNQKTRWGSCSKKGNLSFNWRLMLLPPEMADYVVVHELCHLSYFDHSVAFWGEVGRAIPNHADIRKRMRRI